METLILTELLDGSLIAYLFGVLFGIASILYFARDILLSLSITSKLYLLFSSTTVLFIFGVFVSSLIATTISIALASGSYVVMTSYFMSKYNLEKIHVFLTLLSSSGVFMIVGYALQNELLNVTTELLIGIIGLIGLIGIIITLLDWQEEDYFEYEYTGEKEISINQMENFATVTCKNKSKFRREFDKPNVNIILSEEEHIPIRVQSHRNQKTLRGGKTLEFELEHSIPDMSNEYPPLQNLSEDKIKFEVESDGREFRLNV